MSGTCHVVDHEWVQIEVSSLNKRDVLPFHLYGEPDETSRRLQRAGTPVDDAEILLKLSNEGYFQRRMLGAYARSLDLRYVESNESEEWRARHLVEAGRVALMALLDEPTAPHRQLATTRWARRVALTVHNAYPSMLLKSWPHTARGSSGSALRVALAMACVGQSNSWSLKSLREQIWASLIHGLGDALVHEETLGGVEAVIALISTMGPIPEGVYNALRCYRERMDGSGPLGIRHGDIPIEAQYLGAICWLESRGLFQSRCSHWSDQLDGLRPHMTSAFRSDVVTNVCRGLQGTHQ
jgi:hypothetical protein